MSLLFPSIPYHQRFSEASLPILWDARKTFTSILMCAQGNRENIDGMAPGSQKILTQVMKLIDSHDLYGSVAYPKKHEQKDISDIYLLPYATRGIFTNVALQEPFGLTVIEARMPSTANQWRPACMLYYVMRTQSVVLLDHCHHPDILAGP